MTPGAEEDRMLRPRGRVLIVLPDLPASGPGRQARMLALELRDSGFVVAFLALLRGGEMEAELRRDGFPCRIANLRSGRLCTPGNLLRTWRELAAWRPDVILAYSALPNFYCGLLWRGTSARACVWNQRDAGICRPHRTLERLAARCTPWFVANAAVGKEFLVREVGVPPGRVRVIHNAVAPLPPCSDRALRRARLGLPPDARVAAMVANITPFKDHLTLVRAWRGVVEATAPGHARPVLLLLGRPDAPAKAVREEAERLGIGGDVRFMGYVPDVGPVLAACDMGVFSSVSEGMPNGVIECMAAGLAVVATDIPGVRECLPPEDHAAALVPPRDPAALAARLLDVLGDDALREAMASRARQRASEQFSPRALREATLSLLNEVPA